MFSNKRIIIWEWNGIYFIHANAEVYTHKRVRSPGVVEYFHFW